MSEEANPGMVPPLESNRIFQRQGGIVFDFREAFWRQWDRCLYLMSSGENLTGAIEALYATARLGADAPFMDEWKDRPIHGYKDKGGKPVYVPTLQDNLIAFEIIGDLARRKGWAERKRIVSEMRPWQTPSSNGTPSGVGFESGAGTSSVQSTES